MNSKNRILLVEDDESFGYILTRYLEMNDFNTHWLKNGTEASEHIKEKQYDLGILDVMLPGMDGYTLAGIWTKYQEDVPFLFLTAKSLKVDKLQGYKTGCIDYIVKPIEEEVFIAKIHALLKKSTQNNHSIYRIGQYEFLPESHRLQYGDNHKYLTSRESQLLAILCESRNKVVDRQKILKELWGKNDYFNRKSMDVFIFKLRKYLSEDPSVQITNVHGKGFILEINP